MIQRPASGAFNLELCELANTGEKSLAITASTFFQHLQSLMNSARLRPARASSEGLGWLAGYVCDLAATGSGLNTPCGRPLFFRANEKAPNLSGLLCFWRA
ncbi:hypothetical protein D3C81_712970 [compost metagenome]